MGYEIVVSLSAMVVGVLALFVSIWQGFETRKNYRLSVTPKISIVGRWIKGSDTIGLLLQNSGIGPAVITKIVIRYNQKNIDLFENSKGFSLVYKEIVEKTAIHTIRHYSMDAGDMLPVGISKPFIWLTEKDKDNEEKIQRLHNFFQGTSIIIKYESLYGQKFSYTYHEISPPIEDGVLNIP